jgi:uracil-DNA glycosylase
MWRTDLWQFLDEAIFPIDADRLAPCGAGPLFNPWRDRDRDRRFDRPDGPRIRRANLKRYIDSHVRRPPVLVIGEAPGPWDCRFSGVPITGERQLVERSLVFGGRVIFDGERSSRYKPAVPGSQHPPFKSPSSEVFWNLMGPHHAEFLIWNCVPLHPYNEGYPLTVRAPTATEIRLFGDLLREFVAIVSPDRLVAMGRKAETALERIGADCRYVRHPSQGGAPEFRAAMTQVFGAD